MEPTVEAPLTSRAEAAQRVSPLAPGRPAADPPLGAATLPRSAVAAGLATCAALLAAYALSAFTRYLINDDYQTLYTAWLKSQGKVAGRDYFLTSYYLLVDLLAPIMRLTGESWFPLYATRLALVAAMATTAMLLHRVTARVAGDAAALLAPILWLGSTSVLHRGLDLRPDLLTSLLWMAVVACLLAPRALARLAVAVVGALLALAILNRFKGALILPAIGASYLFLSWTPPRGRWRRLLAVVGWSAVGAAAVVLPYLLWIAASDGLAEFVRVNRDLYADLGGRLGSGGEVRRATMFGSLRADWWFWLAVALGVFASRIDLRGRLTIERLVWITLPLLGAASVALNPGYYAYNLVTLQLLLAPLAARGLVAAAARWRPAAAGGPPALALVALAVLPLLLQARVIRDVTRDTNGHQKALARFIAAYVPRDRAVFALEGVGLFRPAVYHWRFPAVLAGRYAGGGWSFAEEFRQQPPELVIASYRVPGWLTPADRAFLGAHYVPLTPLVLVPGLDTRDRRGVLPLELLTSGPYEVRASPGGSCRLDGASVDSREPRLLRAGAHRLEVVRGRCLVRRYYPPEALALLANPRGLPYFTAPGLEVPAPIYRVVSVPSPGPRGPRR
jgi:hypothetical protein